MTVASEQGASSLAMSARPTSPLAQRKQGHMSTATLNDTDPHVRDAVQRQLERDPDVDASGIGVAASKGVITLTGSVSSYAGKLAAGRAAKRVRGVRAVANDVIVHLAAQRTDTDIAADVTQALHESANLDARQITVTVAGGTALLRGRVSTWLQREIAERAAADAPGITVVENRIEVEPRRQHDTDEIC
jgi:osmotically-inducible protein OsmY